MARSGRQLKLNSDAVTLRQGYVDAEWTIKRSLRLDLALLFLLERSSKRPRGGIGDANDALALAALAPIAGGGRSIAATALAFATRLTGYHKSHV